MPFFLLCVVWQEGRCFYVGIKDSNLLPVFFVFDICHDIPRLTVQDPAENFDRVRADALVSLQSGDLSGADIVFFDQRVLRDAVFLHHAPQFVV